MKLDEKKLEFARGMLSEEAWLPTPLLPARTIGDQLGLELWLKREDCSPAGSFKLRGALLAMAALSEGLSDEGVYVASSGNYGVGIALAGQRHNVKVTVVVPKEAALSKIERIRLSGAEIIQYVHDDQTTKEELAQNASQKLGASFWDDGVEWMTFGAACIATELLSHPEPWDCILVPLGGGNLMKGIAAIFKERSPQTRLIGIVPASAPLMYQAMIDPPWDRSARIETIADGLAIRAPDDTIVKELRPLVDEIWLSDESKILPAVKSLMELEQVMAEPASATTMVGLSDHRAELRGKRVAAIITGAHLKMSLIPELAHVTGLI